MTLIKTDKTKRRFSRRAMLASIGASAACLPLINAERAQAAGDAGFPKRLLTVTWGHGACQNLFYPTDGTSKSQILAPMADYADKMLVVAGLDYKDLQLTTRLNGEVRQSQRTSDLLFSVDKVVSYVSQFVTLLPGDLIYTGTPGNTKAMKPGDVVEVEIEGVGVLRNKVAGPRGGN